MFTLYLKQFFFGDLNEKLDPVEVAIFKSQFSNLKRQKSIWTTENKIFILTLLKKGSQCY